MRFLAAAILFGFGVVSAVSAEGPAPSSTPGPREEMAGELAALRMSQAVALAQRTTPLAAEEIARTSEVYRGLIARFPKEAEPHAAFGEFLHLVGQRREAFEEWQAALALDPGRHDLLAAQADLLVQIGEIVPATDALEKAAALAPNNAAYQYGLAHFYSMFRNDLAVSRRATPDELITRGTAYFRRAAELAPENPVYLRAYAEAFYTQPGADWTLAKAAWESLLPRSPDKDFVHSHLVRVNIRLHDKAGAEEHLAQLTSPAFAAMKVALQKQIDKL